MRRIENMKQTNINFSSIITYDITIGLNSMITRESTLHVEEVKEIICNYLYKNQVDFSLRVKNGGYTYSDDSFVLEKSIVLTFVGGDIKHVTKIARNLKMLLEQETILVTKRNMEASFV